MKRIRHWRFMLAFGAGCMIWGTMLLVTTHPILQILAAVDGFAVIYIGLVLHLAQTQDADDLRHHAAEEDEGIVLILGLALVVVALSLTAIFGVLRQMSTDFNLAEAILGLLAVPLGWGMVHMVAAFHYAYLYYSRKPEGGLNFPGTKAPAPWDFIYFAFGIGMTAQVSDVTVTFAEVRRVVTVHAVGSFFYNTVILALSVNAAIAMAA